MDINGIAVYDAPVYTPPPPAPAQEEITVDSTAVQQHVQQQHFAQPPERDTQTNVRSMETLEKAINQINNSISSFHRHMEISVHQKTNRIMVKVMNTEKNEIIREIPSEKVLDAFAKALELAGILIDQKR